MWERMSALVARAMPQVKIKGEGGKNVQLGYVKGDVNVYQVYLPQGWNGTESHCPLARATAANERDKQ